MAIWSYANGSNHALDGTDRMIVGDVYYGSSALGDSLNGKNDYAGAARTRALYEYLINLNEKQESTIVINEKNNIDNLSLTIGDKADGFEANYNDNADNDVYEAELNFTLEFVPDPESDDLLVHITYMQNGEEVVVTRRLAGENTEERNAETITAVNGVYTLTGLHLSENSDFTFDLRRGRRQPCSSGTSLVRRNRPGNRSRRSHRRSRRSDGRSGRTHRRTQGTQGSRTQAGRTHQEKVHLQAEG
ncbi:MAG: hypothetical protein IKU40_04565 [Clostridia bacterium]|nr:hypothetical protein [Clostridia bacterium]